MPAVAVLTGLLFAGAVAPEAAAQAPFDCDWNGGSANWATATQWSSCNGNFPNNGGGDTYDATIDSTGDTVTLNSAVEIENLDLDNGLLEHTANSLTVNGTVTIAGTATYRLRGARSSAAPGSARSEPSVGPSAGSTGSPSIPPAPST